MMYAVTLWLVGAGFYGITYSLLKRSQTTRRVYHEIQDAYWKTNQSVLRSPPSIGSLDG